MIKKHSFMPIINENSTILILGSLPSDKSIEENQYYAHRTNHFWNIIISVFNGNKSDIKTYELKKKFLLKNNVALWDMYKQAKREGSMDINIKDGEFNDIENLLRAHPKIKLIILNGTSALKAYEKYKKDKNLNYPYKYVPSSSSLNASYSFNDKVKCWENAIKF